MHNIPVKNKNSGVKKFQYILVSCNKIFSFAVKSKDFNAQMSKWLKLGKTFGFQLPAQLLIVSVCLGNFPLLPLLNSN